MLYIFTPTYNRESYLQKLYSSLVAQRNKNFIWLIVDDGSIDNTEALVKSWQEEDKIYIIYLYQENQGKHIAYNRALEYMGNHGFHVCVDSDDSLAKTAVDTFFENLAVILDRDEYIGVVYPKVKYGQEHIVNGFPTDVNRVNVQDIQLKYGLHMETCIVISNTYANLFRFPRFVGEKFVSEEMLYIYLSQFGGFYPVNKAVYYFEYLEEGLTKNIFRLWLKNPKGTMVFLEKRKEYILKHFQGFIKYREWLKVKLNINAFQLAQNDIDLAKDYSLLDYFLLPVSLLVKHRRFNKKKALEKQL